MLPPIFLRRLSDAWNEEHAAAIAEFGDGLDDDIERDYHRFVLPDTAHWRDPRKVTDNVWRSPSADAPAH